MFLEKLVKSAGDYPWTGGHRQPETPSGSWTWSDGALWSYTKWGIGSPDIYQGKQSYSGYQFILLF